MNTYKLMHGSYYLTDESKINPITNQPNVVLMTDEVALAIDIAEGVLHKHGIPENVSSWNAVASKKMRDAGMDEWADNLVVVTGAFPVEEINKCLEISGYAKVFYEKLMSNQITTAKPNKAKM